MRNNILFVMAAVLFTTMGCATCPPPDVIEVPVPVPVQAPELPMPDVPVWKTPITDPTDPNAYIRALTSDLVKAWKWGSELRHVIEAHNEALANDE